MTHPFDVARCRRQFPGLQRRVAGQPAVFFDGPAGSQVPSSVVQAMGRYLTDTNANMHGQFATSRESDAVLKRAHQAAADLVGSREPDLVVFGANMTTLTFALARALGRTWGPGDEVLLTSLEHDANFTPWVQAAEDAGATVRQAAIQREDCTLDLDDWTSKLGSRTRLVAFTAVSNIVGSILPVREMVTRAHQAGAQVFIDAVHLAPHLSMDVEAWDCDYLTCSAYKFFGPHVGILYGKREHLEQLPVHKLRPSSDALPYRWMTGTQSHEGMAGTLAAIDYLADLGRHHGGKLPHRRAALQAAFAAIEEHERNLVRRLLDGLAEIPAVTVWGITDPQRLDQRVPTVALTHAGKTARQMAGELGKQGIFTWSGNFYSVPLTEALDLEPEGVLRIGLMHYNTAEEIDRLLVALRGVA
ncbi:MAG: cysteine desulfurase-like protein [Acidobacteria bacterium]|nr:MAG: cysteine desulfurase-like protein [Acidobacteriota bacterium]